MIPRPLLLAALLPGCSLTTQYTPEPSDQLRLVLVGAGGQVGVPAVTDGREKWADGYGGLPTTFFCDPEAQRAAVRAGSAFQTERTARLVGAVSTVMMLVPVAVPMMIWSEERWQSANASLVDAVNRYNDAPKCRKVADAR